jgi:hypothetical protein
MIDAIRSKGHHPTDDNEADAIALAYLARELNGSTQEIAQ